MSHLLDQAKEAMEPAKRDAERARHDYNYNQEAKALNRSTTRTAERSDPRSSPWG